MKSIDELRKFTRDCRAGLRDPLYEIDTTRWVRHLTKLVRSVRLEESAQEQLLDEMREQVEELRAGVSRGRGRGGPR